MSCPPAVSDGDVLDWMISQGRPVAPSEVGRFLKQRLPENKHSEAQVGCTKLAALCAKRVAMRVGRGKYIAACVADETDIGVPHWGSLARMRSREALAEVNRALAAVRALRAKANGRSADEVVDGMTADLIRVRGALQRIG